MATLEQIADAYLALIHPDKDGKNARHFQQLVCESLSEMPVSLLQRYVEFAINELLSEEPPRHSKSYQDLLIAVMSADFSKENRKNIDDFIRDKLFVTYKNSTSEHRLSLLSMYLGSSSTDSLLSTDFYNQLFNTFPNKTHLIQIASTKMFLQIMYANGNKVELIALFKKFSVEEQKNHLKATHDALNDPQLLKDFLLYICEHKHLLTYLGNTPACKHIVTAVLDIFPQKQIVDPAALYMIANHYLNGFSFGNLFKANLPAENRELARKIIHVCKDKIHLSNLDRILLYRLLKEYMMQPQQRGQELYTKLLSSYESLKADVADLAQLHEQATKKTFVFI